MEGTYILQRGDLHTEGNWGSAHGESYTRRNIHINEYTYGGECT